MKKVVEFIIRKRLTSESLDASLAAVVCYAVGVFVFAFATLKMTRLDLNEKELFFGMLLICCLAGQMVVGGSACEVYRCLKVQQQKADIAKPCT